MLHLCQSHGCTVRYKSPWERQKAPSPPAPPLMDAGSQTPDSICSIDCLPMVPRQKSMSHPKCLLLVLILLPHIIKGAIIKAGGAARGALEIALPPSRLPLFPPVHAYLKRAATFRLAFAPFQIKRAQSRLCFLHTLQFVLNPFMLQIYTKPNGSDRTPTHVHHP